MNNRSKTQKMVGIAILGALAVIIQQLSFPIFPIAPFLKIDFADVPVLLGMFAYGPASGIGIAFVKSVINYLLSGGEAGIPIGDISNFIATVAMILPVYYALKILGNTVKGKIVGLVGGAVGLTVVMSLVNYFIMLPMYIAVMDFPLPTDTLFEYVLVVIAPFNVIKAALVIGVFYIVWRALEPWVRRTFHKK